MKNNAINQLSNVSTDEIEKILDGKLNLVLAIDRFGKIKRIYPNHIDQSSLKDGKTTSLVINTKIPLAEIEEENNFFKNCFSYFIYCPCGRVGGKCAECD